jgi:predicted nucleic acid-binding protein
VIVVSDSGPLLYLGAAGRLPLLQLLYGVVVVPRQVWREVVERGAGEPGAAEVAAASFIRVDDVLEAGPMQRALQVELDEGEAAALALAARLQADLVLMDERKGRRTARQLGFRIRGTLGVLLDAKKAGHIELVGPILDQLRNSGMWIAEPLVLEVLELAGER